MSILVTGGTGYIGSHTVVELLNRGDEVVIVDNLSNSKISVLDRIEKITGKRPEFIKCDLLDATLLDSVFDLHPEIESVIHFAGLKAVGESCSLPLLYYHNNITGTVNLISSMLKHKVSRIVFSSSATVYGLPKTVPIKEDFPLSTTNPYGETKLMIERILKDCTVAYPELSVCILRYFNPIGAHESGLIGEDPRGIPNNLLPYISKVAAGKLECLSVFGNDYDTPDGTGVRDYIHVVDLSLAHLKAVDYTKSTKGIDYFNVGTGNGYSVLEMVRAFGDVWGSPVKYKITARRPGDIAECYADPQKAADILGWRAERNLQKMCEDAARWQKMNPDGYPD
ncbi:MAG: UDP-glucose 4-epimerase GalE [Ruminococcaceae bacterium]|nr:UDP-glucose 4-epimerase GalE [Oscillospiraceae bacterium]